MHSILSERAGKSFMRIGKDKLAKENNAHEDKKQSKRVQRRVLIVYRLRGRTLSPLEYHHRSSYYLHIRV